MADSLTPAQRSVQMSRIRGADTKLELMVRKGLHARGLRFRLGGRGLPGRPDVVLPKHCAVVFVHGCFWHGHTCHLFRVPKTRSEFWTEKIESNRKRDERVKVQLIAAGWNVFEIWECSLRGLSQNTQNTALDDLTT